MLANLQPGLSPFLVAIGPSDDDFEGDGYGAQSPCNYALHKAAMALDVTVEQLKTSHLGPRKQDMCVLPNDDQGPNAWPILTFRTQAVARTTVMSIGKNHASFVTVGRNVNNDLNNICQQPWKLTPGSHEESRAAALIFCGYQVPDGKSAFGAICKLGGALSHGPCSICSAGNGEDHKCTNIGVHSSKPRSPNYDDVRDVKDMLRCNIMELVTSLSHIGHIVKVNHATWYLRESEMNVVWNYVTLLKFSSLDLGLPPEKPIGPINGAAVGDADDADDIEADELFENSGETRIT